MARRPRDVLGVRDGNVILGWYMLVETQSVFMRPCRVALYIGTLLSPMFAAGDHIGQRALSSSWSVCGVRPGAMAFSASSRLRSSRHHAGRRPGAALGYRHRAALVGEIMPLNQLIGAMGTSTTRIGAHRGRTLRRRPGGDARQGPPTSSCPCSTSSASS
jgi:hypothetical protein